MSTIVPGMPAGLPNKKSLPGANWVYKSLDAALTAHLRPGQGVKELFQLVIRRRTSNYNRIAALLNLLDRLLPGTARHVAVRLLRYRHFPLVGYETSLLAYGSGATVFLLKKGRDQKVLKIFRRSLGMPIWRVQQVAREFQSKHRALVNRFNGVFEVVIPSHFMLLHGPLLGVPSAAVVQPYVPGRKYDLFLDFTIDEMVQHGMKNEHLRLQLLDFSERLFQMIEETGLCFDLVGRENLMLVEASGKLHLAIADNGMFDVEKIRMDAPALYDRLQAHLQHLRLLSHELERSETAQINHTLQ